MALSNSDGSIVLSTKVDTSGLNKGMSQLQSKASSLTNAFKGLAAAIGLAFSVGKIIQFSKEAGELATKTEASVQRLIDIYGSASRVVGDFIDANAQALGMSKSAAANFSSVYGNLFSVWADQETNAKLTNAYLNMTAVVASKTGRTIEDVQERIRSGLLGNTEAIEDLGVFVNVKTIEMTNAFQRMANGKSWEQLDAYTQQQIRSMAILEQATSKYGTAVSNTSATIRNKFNAAYQDFKNSWGELINTILIPVLNVLTKIFMVATAVINTLTGNTGGILGSGNIVEQENSTNKIPENIEQSTENQKDFTDAVEETNKEIKKTLAGFDDLQILSENAVESVNDFDDSISGIVGDDLEILLPQQETSKNNFDPFSVVRKIKEALDFILPVIAISLVVIGLILIATGNIGWGIGFIIGGAYLYTVSERSVNGFDFGVIKEDFEKVLPFIDDALVAIGLFLMFFGQIGWGIGFIIGGAVAYTITEVIPGEYDEADFLTKLALITDSVSAALVAIGLILIFFGKVPLGLGFIVAGKKLHDVSEEQLNESGITSKVSEFLEENKKLFDGVPLAMVAIGLILLLGKTTFLRGIGLIAAGAYVLAEEEKLSKDAIMAYVQEFLSEYTWETFLVGNALIILGIILCLTGVGVGYGIGMILEGATAVYASVSTDWTTIETEIDNFFRENWKAALVIAGALIIIGIILCFTGAGVGFGIAAIGSGAGLVFKSVEANYDSIKKTISDFVTTNYTKIVESGEAMLLIGLILLIIPGMFGTGLTVIGIAAGMLWGATSISQESRFQEAFAQGKLEVDDFVDYYNKSINGIMSPDVSGFTFPEVEEYLRNNPIVSGSTLPANPSFAARGTNSGSTGVGGYSTSLNGSNVSAGSSSVVVMEVDGREFGRVVIEQGNLENARIGTSLVVN